MVFLLQWVEQKQCNNDEIHGQDIETPLDSLVTNQLSLHRHSIFLLSDFLFNINSVILVFNLFQKIADVNSYMSKVFKLH